jgi:hypothetical protein
MPGPAIHLDDVVVVNGGCVARTNVSIPGRYALANRRRPDGDRREFACRTLTISSEAIMLSAPVCGPLGERVIAAFDELGKLEGKIVRLIEHGFEMRLTQGPSQREVLTGKIEWLERNKHLKLQDVRLHKRKVPKNSHSTVLLPDGSVLSCFVIDMSVSGAAVSAELSPRLGDVLAVGKIVGRVVRVFSEGFAIRFIRCHDPDVLESLLIQS